MRYENKKKTPRHWGPYAELPVFDDDNNFSVNGVTIPFYDQTASLRLSDRKSGWLLWRVLPQ